MCAAATAPAAGAAAAPVADDADNGFARAMEKAALRLATINANRPAKDDEAAPRKLDLAKTSTMNLEALNTLVVQLRKFVRMARVRTIHKLARAIKKLRTRKGTEEQSTKNAAKAERFAEEISVLKAANADRIAKFALSNTLTLSDVHKQKQPGAHLRALTRLAEHESLREQVQRWRSEHADWEELGAFLLSKNTGRRFRKKKVKATAVSKELNKTLLKETIKKAAKEIGDTPSIEADLVDADQPGTELGRPLHGLDQEASNDALSSSQASDNGAEAPTGSGSSDSDSDAAAATQDGRSDDDSSDSQSEDGSQLKSKPGKASRVRVPVTKSADAVRQQRKEQVGTGRSSEASDSPKKGSRKNEPSKQLRRSKAAGPAYTVHSGEMVVARIDLSSDADHSTSGCIVVPDATTSVADKAPDASRADGEACLSSAPAAAPKKKSPFFLQGDGDGADVDSGGDDADGGEVGGVSTDDDGSSGDEGEGHWMQSTFRSRSAPKSSMFMSSLHGRGSSDRGRTAAQPFARRGGSQPARFSHSSGWTSRPHAETGSSARGGHWPDNRVKARGPSSSSARGLRQPLARRGGQQQLKYEPAKPAEKLHPSWEASKKRKAMEKLASQPFCGKKIKFDDD